MQKELPAHAKNKPIELWFQDEARVGQKGTLTYIWAKTGTRPRMPHDQRYDCAYIFGAVCPARDTGVALVLPDADIPAMNLHLKAISKHVRPDAHAVVLIDGAGWHKEGGYLRVPRNITLIRFPSYCPELNAQENIWEYLRPNFLAGQVFDTYNDILDGCCVAWRELLAIPGKIKSIASRNWLQYQQVFI